MPRSGDCGHGGCGDRTRVEGSQGGDIRAWGGWEGEEMARQRGWALGEHSRPEPAFLSEYPNPADFSPRGCQEGLGP